MSGFLFWQKHNSRKKLVFMYAVFLPSFPHIPSFFSLLWRAGKVFFMYRYEGRDWHRHKGAGVLTIRYPSLVLDNKFKLVCLKISLNVGLRFSPYIPEDNILLLYHFNQKSKLFPKI